MREIYPALNLSTHSRRLKVNGYEEINKLIIWLTNYFLTLTEVKYESWLLIHRRRNILLSNLRMKNSLLSFNPSLTKKN